MRRQSSSAKKRYNIFNDELFLQPQPFKRVPIHFQFQNNCSYILDHTQQTKENKKINTSFNTLNSSRTKIFEKRRSFRTINSSVDFRRTDPSSQKNQRKRNHTIFSNKNSISHQSDDTLKDNIIETVHPKQKRLSIQSYINISNVEKTAQQNNQIESKIKYMQDEKIKSIIENQFGQPSKVSSQHKVISPQQYASLLRRTRAIKNKKINIVYDIPRVLTEFPQSRYMNSPQVNKPDCLIFKI